MALPRHAFFRGSIVPYAEARVGVLTHGLNYGTGCFAGIRAYWNPEEQELFVFRPQDHFRRFLESAKLLDMTLPYSVADLTEALVGLLRAELYREDCYARPLAFYADESIGVRLHNLTPAVSIVAMPYGRLEARGRQHDPRARQDHRLLRQLRLCQDRRPARRVR
jgi:branched-chain amino acid aminotransferase